VSDFSDDLDCTLSALYVHPLKSVGGVAVSDALLVETGLEFDRTWMVVDEHGEMLTQREWPRLALVRTTLRSADMVLRAPGMLTLYLELDAVESHTRAKVWDDIVKAYDMGPIAAQWFTDFLGRPARLVRFDPEEKRLSDPKWAGTVAAENAFGDGFPLLVIGQSSLDDLNARLAAQGLEPAGMERFRPNLVLSGLQPYDEDHIDELEILTHEGPVVLRLVKPCARCSIPNVNPLTAEPTHQPGDTLAGYRADARVEGAITFGMNAVVLQGFDCILRRGQPVRGRWRFD
jgi:uncharacterized protein YcbX